MEADSQTMASVVKRLRRAQGQIGGVIRMIEEGRDCADGNLCTGTEHCVSGSCVAGTALNCNDNDPCSVDSCDALIGCQHAPDDSAGRRGWSLLARRRIAGRLLCPEKRGLRLLARQQRSAQTKNGGKDWDMTTQLKPLELCHADIPPRVFAGREYASIA